MSAWRAPQQTCVDHTPTQGRVRCALERAEVRALLAPIYAWFTEEFDTADIQEAKVLLDELT
jgi:predicted ATPase